MILSQAEIHIVKLIAESKRYSEIAEIRGVSMQTIKGQVMAIHHKLGLHNIAGVTRWAIKEGLVKA